MGTVNENREGYKKTKLGWAPLEWKLIELGSVSAIYDGTHATPKYVDKGIPFYSVEHISKNNFEKTKFISQEVFEKENKRVLLEKGDVLMTRIGDVGTAKLISWNVKASFYVSLALIKPTKCLNSKFLELSVNSSLFQSELNKRMIHVAFPIKINLGEIGKCLILLPPLKEQKKIAEILSTWDNAIEHTQALVDKLKVRKKGLMQQLLTGKTRLPGFSEKWNEVKLGDITSRITKKNTVLNDNVVTISAQRGFVRQEDFFKKRVASNTLSGYYLINKGDFAYNKSYSNGYPMGAFKRLNKFDKAVVTTLYICFSILDNVDSDFMVNYFEGGLITNNLMKIAQEGGRAHGLLNISLGDFFSLKLTIPPLKEQTQIAKVLTEADKEIKQQQAYLDELKNQKKGLMQQLLTGQKRVKYE